MPYPPLGLVRVLATFVGAAIVLLLLLSLLGGIGSLELMSILLLALVACGVVWYATRRSKAAA